MRACAVDAGRQRDPKLQFQGWRIARIPPLPSRGQHGLDVAARVRDEAGKPLSGHLTFGRGEHLACVATLSNGLGKCTLFDSHGHALHHEDRRGSTYVTFSGSVAPDEIVPPTTMV